LSTSSIIARKLDSHAHPPFKLPSSKNNRWVERQPFNKMYEYTTDPLPFPKTGGRGPNGMYCSCLCKKCYFVACVCKTGLLSELL